jgi:hypothetical protein
MVETYDRRGFWLEGEYKFDYGIIDGMPYIAFGHLTFWWNYATEEPEPFNIMWGDFLVQPKSITQSSAIAPKQLHTAYDFKQVKHKRTWFVSKD